MFLAWDVAAACLAAAAVILVIKKRNDALLRLPPGPQPEILFGNARQLPSSRSWEVYTKWKQIYGDVVYARVFGRSVVILNSITAARDLLEQKGRSFLDRPSFHAFHMMGWGHTLQVLPHGPRLKKYRRIMHQYLGPQGLMAIRPTQEHEIRKFLRRLLDEPDNFKRHIHNFIAGIVLSIVYGHEVVSDDDALARLIERAVHKTGEFGNFGTTFFDIFPFLRYVPAWFPGMKARRVINEIRQLVDSVITEPLKELKQLRALGTVKPCMLSDLLDNHDEMDVSDLEHEQDIMNIGLSIYSAGEDTSKSLLIGFFLLMTLHPEVAKKAQHDIDQLTGKDRLPAPEDRKHLPYIDCILKELYRLLPPNPIGVPHTSMEVEHYRDWILPEGTMALPNIWIMMQDPTVFPNPGAFLPERHMEKVKANLKQAKSNKIANDDTEDIAFVAADDPSTLVFGFGRRACPGRYFADANLWLAVANILAMFDINPYTNTLTGKVELPKLELENQGALAHCKDFKCVITPRDKSWASNMTIDV